MPTPFGFIDPGVPFPPPASNPEPDAPGAPENPYLDPDMPDGEPLIPDDAPDMPGTPEPEPELPDPDSSAPTQPHWGEHNDVGY